MILTASDVFLIFSLVDLLLVAVSYITWHQSRYKNSGPFHWLIGYSLLSLGFPLFLINDKTLPLLSLVLPNALIFLGTFEIIRGTYEFQRKKVLFSILLSLVGLGIVLDTWFSLLAPNTPLRIIFSGSIVAILTASVLPALFKVSNKQERLPAFFAGFFYFALSILMLIRALTALMRIVDQHSFFITDTIILLSVVFVFLGIAFAHLQMVHARLFFELELTTQQTLSAEREIMLILSEVVESRSHETAFHVVRVAEYARILAEALGLKHEASLIAEAAPLHDVGKIGIPDNILNKKGPLSPEERQIMQTHTTLGYDILANSDRPLMQMAAIIALEHHERWDGTGYPHQKAQNEISLVGRIVCLCDVFDALSMSRLYKPAWDFHLVLNYITDMSGKMFDPRLVDLLIAKIENFRAVSLRYQDESQLKKRALNFASAPTK